MKRLAILVPLFAIACSGNQNVTLTGTWELDSSMLVENTIDTTRSSPAHYGVTYWIFGEDGTYEESGTYEVKNEISQSGTYKRNEDKIEITITKPYPSGWTYSILRLDEEKLQVMSGLESTGYSMEIYAYLTRVQP